MINKHQKHHVVLDKPQRLDLVLPQLFPQFSRRQLRRWILQGSVWVNGKRIRRQSFVLHPRIPYSIHLWEYDPRAHLQFLESVNWEDFILFKDDWLIAMNKPAGIHVYPTEHALTTSLFYYLKSKQILPSTAKPFHRLDKVVSGVIVFPLGKKTAAHLNTQMQERKITKRYFAIVEGVPEHSQWEIHGYIKAPRYPDHPMQFSPSLIPAGKESATQFVLIATNRSKTCSLVEAIPLTGRTHQIRIHLQVSGFPILNDKRYGGSPVAGIDSRRILLHHRTMRFQHPEQNRPVTLNAPFPDYFTLYFPSSELNRL